MTGRGELALTWFSRLAGLLTLGLLGVLLGYLFWRAWPAWGWGLFFGQTPFWLALSGQAPVWEGIWPACLGSLQLVLLANLLAVPLGLACGAHLALYARGAWKTALGLAVDILAGLPSIVMGLFGFALILFLRHTWWPTSNTCLLLASACLALLILPYLVHTTASTLEGLPPELGLTATALGLSRWQSLSRVLLPAASRGILGGVILALGRAAEDTAVIMLTGVVANAGLGGGLLDKFEALPFHVFYLAAQYQTPQELERGFGAALALLLLTSALFAGASWLRASLERRWSR